MEHGVVSCTFLATLSLSCYCVSETCLRTRRHQVVTHVVMSSLGTFPLTMVTIFTIPEMPFIMQDVSSMKQPFQGLTHTQKRFRRNVIFLVEGREIHWSAFLVYVASCHG